MEKRISKKALLVLDMQEMLLQTLPGADELLPRVAQAIANARSKGIPVIYAAVGFREGFPEVSDRNKSFSAIRKRFEKPVPLQRWTAIAAPVAPVAGEILLVKKRFSAFAGSDLEVVLRAGNIRELVLCGIVTSGVVLSTATQAADLDFGLTFLSDGCKDRDEEVHSFLMEKVFPRYGEVMTCGEWISAGED